MAAGPASARPGRRRHPRWWRHLLLALSLVVVSSSIVGMHQLSLAAAGDVSTSMTGMTGMTGMVEPSAVLPSTATAALGTPDGGTSGMGSGDCPGCGDHMMAVGCCLMALTLLVLVWTLAPPRPRTRPPFLLPRLALAVARPGPGRSVPALSLVELSLRRT